MSSKLKDSGIEWIGDIPETWNIEKGKYTMKPVREVAGEKHVNYPRLSLANAGVIERPKYDGNGQSPADYNTYQIVPKGTFVFNMMGLEQDSNYRRVGIPNVDGLLSSGYIRLDHVPHKLFAKYGYYYYLDLEARRIFNIYGTGIRSTLTGNQLASIPLLLPPLHIQEKIADFLDKKVAIIDEIIADTKWSIEKLKAYKQSIITEAVTKGLRNDKCMVDSGVAWIGNVPNDWTISKFKYEFYVRGRVGWKGLTASEYIEEKGYAFLSTPDIKGEFIDFTNVVHITKDRYEESPEIMLSVGDVLLTKDGSTIGTNNIVRELPEPTTVNSSLAVLKTKGRVEPLYLYYWLSSSYIQETSNFIKNGMGVPHLFQRDINEFYILIPPKSEQIEIINYLENSIGKINDLILLKNKLLGEYELYKKSLIYEYVTGKKQVL